MVEGGAEQGLLDAVLTLARERDLLSAGGRQRTNSTHVLAAVRVLNRLECAIETMRHALESLAVAAPDWLRAHAEPDWAERYGHRAMDDRLAKNATRREERARTIGGDGHALLAAALDHREAIPRRDSPRSRLEGSAGLAAAGACGRDPAARLGAAVLSFGTGRELAHG